MLHRRHVLCHENHVLARARPPAEEQWPREQRLWHWALVEHVASIAFIHHRCPDAVPRTEMIQEEVGHQEERYC